MQQLTILLVEDNHADAAGVREALQTSLQPVTLHVVPDGPAALAFLLHQPPFADVPRPDVVILDLTLAQTHSQNLLATVRHTPALQGVPMVVFSGSCHTEDSERNYALGATWSVNKPAEPAEFGRAVRTLVEQWARFQGEPHESPTIMRTDLLAFSRHNDK